MHPWHWFQYSITFWKKLGFWLPINFKMKSVKNPKLYVYKKSMCNNNIIWCWLNLKLQSHHLWALSECKITKYYPHLAKLCWVALQYCYYPVMSDTTHITHSLIVELHVINIKTLLICTVYKILFLVVNSLLLDLEG